MRWFDFMRRSDFLAFEQRVLTTAEKTGWKYVPGLSRKTRDEVVFVFYKMLYIQEQTSKGTVRHAITEPLELRFNLRVHKQGIAQVEKTGIAIFGSIDGIRVLSADMIPWGEEEDPLTILFNPHTVRNTRYSENPDKFFA